MKFWHEGKLSIERALAIDHDILHVMAGAVIWLLCLTILRRPVRAWLPWLCTLVAALWNEASDLWVEIWPDPFVQYGEGAKDVLLTMLIPTTVMLISRFRPDLLRGRAPRSDDDRTD